MDEGVDRPSKRLIVKHAAVDEIRVRRGSAAQLVNPKATLRKLGQRRADRLAEAAQTDRWEHGWDARRRTGGERETSVIAQLIRAVTAVAEVESMTMPRIGHEPRPCDRDQPLITVEVSDRDEQIERTLLRHQRDDRVGSAAAGVHLSERVIEPTRHVVTAKRRAMDGLTKQQRQLDLPRKRNPEQLAPTNDELIHVATVEPELAQSVLGEIRRQCLCQENPVDPARRSSRDHIDNHAKIKTVGTLVSQPLKQLVIDRLALSSRQPAPLAQRRRFHEPVDLLRDPMHIDAKR